MSKQPSFAHLVVYHARPEHVDAVVASMREAAGAAAGSPGLLHIGPWRDPDTGAIIALSVWESEEAFDRFANDRLLPALKKLVGAQASQIRPAFGQLPLSFA